MNQHHHQEPVPATHSRATSLELEAATRPPAAVECDADGYRRVRHATEELCRPLAAEDCTAQSMADASPAKWHLAHTTWFFENFVLQPAFPDRPAFHPEFGFLFNSYYNAVGSRHPRPQRGLLTRPPLAAVYEYRAAVDQAMLELLERQPADSVQSVIEIGLHHEQQHQELILTDIKHLFSCNPLRPAYAIQSSAAGGTAASPAWIDFDEAIAWIGHEGDRFCYDNELPRHRVLLEPFQLASRLVTNGEYLAFMADGGYERPEFWLSDGWDSVQSLGWQAPLYWERLNGEWYLFTLAGMHAVAPAGPVCHVSFYEADAYARWAAARLPTEAEWETAAEGLEIRGNFAESRRFHPSAPIDPPDAQRLQQMFGDVWQWTSSPYTAYPGYRPPAGALGEYNGKFMCNQIVLRGGSCATPRSHMRATYRNFFQPQARWQFSGIRLARDV